MAEVPSSTQLPADKRPLSEKPLAQMSATEIFYKETAESPPEREKMKPRKVKNAPKAS